MTKQGRVWTEGLHLYSVNFLKGVSIIGIILVHTKMMWQLPSFIKVVQLGQLGCVCFFVISGVLSVSSIKKVDCVFDFYKKKLRNILPMYWLSLFIYWAIDSVIEAFGISSPILIKRTLYGVLANLFMINGLVPQYNNNIVPGGWYIGTLVILYLLTPIIIKVMDSMNEMIYQVCFYCTCIVCFCIQLALFLILPDRELFGNNSFFYFSWINQLPGYLVGINVGYMMNSRREIGYNNIILVFSGILGSVFVFTDNPVCFMIVPTFFAIFCGGIIINLEKRLKKCKCDRSILWKLCEDFGENSFYCYILHIIFAVYMQGFIKIKIEKTGLQIPELILWIICIPYVYLFTLVSAKMLRMIHQKVRKKRLDGKIDN